MKIEKNNAFRITGTNQSLNVLKNLSKGSGITAKITDRLNSKEAILDISGSRIRVDFLKGVPDTNNLYLLLEDKNNETYFFKILERSSEIKALDRMLEFTIFNLDDIKQASIGQINSFLRDGLPGIFAFNIFLMKILRDDSEFTDNRLSSLLNKLMNLGIKMDNLIFLSFLLYSGKGFNFEQLLSILTILGMAVYNNPTKFTKSYKNEKSIQEKVEELFDEIEEQLKEKKCYDVIREIIDDISAIDLSDSKSNSYGEIPYYDDNDLKSIKYIFNKNSIVFSLDLSYLGNLDIIINIDKAGCNITIFCEKENSVKALKSEIDLLQSELKHLLDRNVHFFLYNNKKAVEKIIEINSSLNLTKTIDIRV